jgi:ribonuclease P protein component
MMDTLKDKKVIKNLFENGKTISGGIVIAKYLGDVNKGILFTVSSKKFKRAVDRNRIKRLMRESARKYDLQKSVAFIYVSSEVRSQKEVDISINKIFNGLSL